MNLEQYYYSSHSGSPALVSKASFQGEDKWYGELRYNYDEAHSFSLYGGRTFSKQSDLSWSVTPFAGLVMGELKGVTVGTNIGLDYKKVVFSAAPQYTVSAEGSGRNFIFNWCELGYQATTHFYAGLALQETHNNLVCDKWVPGIQLGFSCKEWIFPVYAFDPMNSKRYFVFGAIWEKKWSK
ncbi:MAG TPA: hypothetical protein VK563_24240 [Puia sp.]|nr:hypothetical protein [Puia sp.]